MKCNSLLESFGSLLFSDFIGDFIDVAESSYKYFWELSVVRVFPIISHWGKWAQCYVIYLLSEIFLDGMMFEVKSSVWV